MEETDGVIIEDGVIDIVGKEDGDNEKTDDEDMLSRTEIDGGLVSVFDILSNADIDDEAIEDGDSLAIANREDVALLLKAPESL